MCGWVDSKGRRNGAGLFAHCASHESSYPASTTWTVWWPHRRRVCGVKWKIASEHKTYLFTMPTIHDVCDIDRTINAEYIYVWNVCCAMFWWPATAAAEALLPFVVEIPSAHVGVRILWKCHRSPELCKGWWSGGAHFGAARWLLKLLICRWWWWVQFNLIKRCLCVLRAALGDRA